MAYIQARYRKNGELLHYRLFVSDGLDWTGKQRRRYKIWTPNKPGMSQKQIEKAALAAAKKIVKKKVSAPKKPKHLIAEMAGFSHTTLNAILRGAAVALCGSGQRHYDDQAGTTLHEG